MKKIIKRVNFFIFKLKTKNKVNLKKVRYKKYKNNLNKLKKINPEMYKLQKEIIQQ